MCCHPPAPSPEIREFVAKTWAEINPETPTYGYGAQSAYEHYGKDNKGTERGRIRTPWGTGRRLEKSFHIEKPQGAKIIVTDEGFYPADK